MEFDIERLRAWLLSRYQLRVRTLSGVPGGADADASAFRIEDEDGRILFVKLSRASQSLVARLTILLGERLGDVIVAPVADVRGRFSARFDGASVTVFPFVAGIDGFRRDPSLAQMRTLGVALRRLHRIDLSGLGFGIPAIRIDDRFLVRFARRLASFEPAPGDPIASEVLGLFNTHRALLERMMGDARKFLLGGCGKTYRPVLCHADLHAGNLLLPDDGGIRIVDWDGAKTGPAETDLMMIGGGIGGKLSDPSSVAAFREGYGPVGVDPELVSLLRHLRIVEDLELFAARILDPTVPEAERRRDQAYILSNFAPGGTIECARGSGFDFN